MFLFIYSLCNIYKISLNNFLQNKIFNLFQTIELQNNMACNNALIKIKIYHVLNFFFFFEELLIVKDVKNKKLAPHSKANSRV